MHKFLLVSTLALPAGTGLTAAQAADDPPGSAFQDQGIRDSDGESDWVRREPSRAQAARSYAAYPTSRVYNYWPDRAPARPQVTVRRKHTN